MVRRLPTLVLLSIGCGAPAHAPATATLTPAAAAAPAPPPLSVPAEAREVHLGNLRQLTFGGENAEAYWSWDGTQIIFQSTRPPFECDQIFRMPIDLGSTDATRVSTGKGRTTCSYFFPGNRRVLYSSTHEHGEACPPRPDFSKGYVWALYDYNIYTAKADGSELTALTQRRGYDAEATVCGKDGTILFTSDRDGDLELYRMDPDGKNVVRLTNAPGYDGGGFFSPDCKKIVWRASRPQGKELESYQQLLKQGLVRPTQLEIWTANADGTEAQQVTYLSAASFAPSWFPSGDRLLFSSNVGDPKGREFEIWAVNVNGTGLERITYSDGFDGFPLLSPDGKRLVFASNRHGKVRGETNLFVADWKDGPGVAEETGADRFLRDVAWLADDARLGRGPDGPGLDAAATWLEGRFKEIGLEPAGSDGYRHAFNFSVGVTVGAKTALRIDGKPVDAATYAPAGLSASATATGRVMAAGYGINAPAAGHNDYKKDVKGKIVLIKRFTAEQPKLDSVHERRYSDVGYKVWEAVQHGAAAVILADLDNPEEKPLPKLVVERFGGAKIPVVFVKREVAAKLLAARRVEVSVELVAAPRETANIVGRIRAGAPHPLPGVVVVGAHYDHLGMGGPASLAQGTVAIHNGADDNASGAAGLLEVARTLMARRAELSRDVVLVAFTAEELGDVGSTMFTRWFPVKDNVVAMLNMDMIGRMRGNKLQAIGGDSAAEWRALLKEPCDKAGVECAVGGGGFGPSDHTPFYAMGVPVVHFFTGAHRDYHRPTDDVEYINAVGGARAAAVVAAAAEAVARGPKLTVRASEEPPPIGDLRVTGASLGTVPDYVGPPEGTSGVLLAGVRPGGPAEAGGLRRGDIVQWIDGHDVRTVEDLMYVLQTSKPGAKVKLRYLREGKGQEAEVTFGAPRR
jgi:Tol biopolymer transport system component/Zn-dependent M28 family amino/carboxypeptidase